MFSNTITKNKEFILGDAVYTLNSDGIVTEGRVIDKKTKMIRTVIRYTDNKILLNDAEVFETSKELFPGLYDIELDEYGRFRNFKILDNPMVYPLVPSRELKNIQEYIDKFLSEDYRALCKKAKILIKSGILLYGDPGIGKSNYINQIINRTINEKKACVFNIDNTMKLQAIIPKIKELRQIQDGLFVIVLEEIDEILNDRGTEAILKNFMDGINSIENSLFISSTNYIDIVPSSLKSRPSRFKKVLEIRVSEDIEEMKVWLSQTYKGFFDDLSDEDCEMLHDMCLNKTIEEIKHILIDYKMQIKALPIEKEKIGFKKKK